MARFRIDSERSQVTVVTRPRLGDGPGARLAAMGGSVETADGRVQRGSLTITLEGSPTAAAIDLVGARPEPGPDGTALLTGRADRPAGAFGLAGPPLLNPTVQLRWRLVLVPETGHEDRSPSGLPTLG